MPYGARNWLAAASFAFAAMITTAHAAEIQLLASTAMREALDELVPQFEKDSGHKVTIAFYPAATLVIKVKEGAPADLVMTTPDNLTELTNTKHLVEGTRVDFVHSRVGVAVKAGAPKPDISTPDALKAAFLAAKSIGVSRGPSGVHLLGQMAKIGIADQVKPKIKSGGPGSSAKMLSAGEVDLVVSGLPPLLGKPNIEWLGLIPAEINSFVVFSAGLSTHAKEPEAGRALLRHLVSPEALAVYKDKGLDPAP